MDALLVIDRNFPWCPQHDDMSFGGRLHEQSLWSWEEYWLLEAALYSLCGIAPDRALHWRVFRIFSYCFASLGHHLDPNDGFEIQNLDREALYDARERFQLVFEGFFEGVMPAQDAFEVSNPILVPSST